MALALVGLPASAQTVPAAAETVGAVYAVEQWTPSRTPWGDPDLQGIWPSENIAGTPFERPAEFGERAILTDEELAAREAQFAAENERVRKTVEDGASSDGGTGPPPHWGENWLRTPSRLTSLIVEPSNGRFPPLTLDGERRVANSGTTGPDVNLEHSLWRNSFSSGPWNGPADLGPYDRCISRGLLASMFPSGYNNGNQILQAPGLVVIRNEMIHETRIIPLDGRPHVSSSVRSYMGDSRGHWERNTLVVETTNFNGRAGARRNGSDIPMSDALRVIERFTRTDADTLHYEVTVEDPKTWTRPWTVAYPMKRAPDYKIFEYACHEGNYYSMTNILSGARAAERSASATSR